MWILSLLLGQDMMPEALRARHCGCFWRLEGTENSKLECLAVAPGRKGLNDGLAGKDWMIDTLDMATSRWLEMMRFGMDSGRLELLVHTFF
jgi:hypothetical protein